MKKNDWKGRWVLFGLIGSLFGCTDSIVYSVPDVSPFVQKNVALLVTKPSVAIEPQLVNALTQKVEQRLTKFSSFSKMLRTSQMESFFKEHLDLKYQTLQYVTSFALTGVSDKDLSSRLAKGLSVDQFLILDFNQYPCSTCNSGKQLLVKLHLIGSTTAELIWRARILTELDEADVEKKRFAEIATESTESILEDFIETFKIPWHFRRYENLKKRGKPAKEQHSS